MPGRHAIYRFWAGARQQTRHVIFHLQKVSANKTHVIYALCANFAAHIIQAVERFDYRPALICKRLSKPDKDIEPL